MVMVISLGVAPSTACSPISQHDLLPSSLTGPPPRRIYCSFSFKCSLMLSLSFFLLFSVPCLFRLTPLPRPLRRACIRRSRTFLYCVFCATCVLVGLIAFSPHASYHVDFLAGLMLSQGMIALRSQLSSFTREPSFPIFGFDSLWFVSFLLSLGGCPLTLLWLHLGFPIVANLWVRVSRPRTCPPSTHIIPEIPAPLSGPLPFRNPCSFRRPPLCGCIPWKCFRVRRIHLTRQHIRSRISRARARACHTYTPARRFYSASNCLRRLRSTIASGRRLRAAISRLSGRRKKFQVGGARPPPAPSSSHADRAHARPAAAPPASYADRVRSSTAVRASEFYFEHQSLRNCLVHGYNMACGDQLVQRVEDCEFPSIWIRKRNF